MHASAECLAFFLHGGGVKGGKALPKPVESNPDRMTLTHPDTLIPGDLDARRLGHTSGHLLLEKTEHVAQAVRLLAAQSRRCIEVMSTDLEPALYDQPAFIDCVRHLAIELRGRLPVRVLLADPAPAIRRGHRLIELSRVLSSDVQIRAIPSDWIEGHDRFMLCDLRGHCLARHQNPRRVLVNFNDAPGTRRLRLQFERIWEQGEIHPGLGRLYI